MITTPYISTFLGNRFYPMEPRIEQVDIEDIAHGLAFQCRFNGQTSEFFSVAQHSLIVASLVPDEIKLEALLHDASEAYLGDMVKPLKVFFPQFSEMEKKIMSIIAQKFKLDFDNYAPIKEADLISLATEKRDLMKSSEENWSYLDNYPALPETLICMKPMEAKAAFLEEFYRLEAGIKPVQKRRCSLG